VDLLPCARGTVRLMRGSVGRLRMFGKKKPIAGEHEGRKVFQCSFCNKSQKEVRKLIAGPNVYICDECVDVCFRIVKPDADEQVASVPSSAGPDDAVICCICRLTTLPAAAVVVSGRGALCSACATAVVEAVAAVPQPPN
jgi:hypothetical protein